MGYETIDLLKIIDMENLPARVERNMQEIQRLIQILFDYENSTGLSVNTTVTDNASTWTLAATNFSTRNDRISEVPADPVIASNGSALEHSLNTDGSADVRFTWSFAGSGNAYDIDGFIVYVRASSLSNPYDMGTAPAEETVYYSSGDKRSFTLSGVPADRYYTFGVQSYRIVDQDINAAGILKSNIVQPSLAAEDPYQPTSDVTITGNINDSDHSSSTVVGILDGFGNGSDGELNSTGNITLPVATEDASSVIKQYTNFTLNAGHTLTVDKRCRGLFIFCQGDVTINGTINMDGRCGKVGKENSVQRLLQIPVGVYVLDVPAGGTGGNGGAGGAGGDSGGSYTGGPGGAGGTGAAGVWFGGGIAGPAGGGGSGAAYSVNGKTGGAAGGNNMDLTIGSGGSAGATGGNFSGGGGASRAYYSGRYSGPGGGGAGVNGGALGYDYGGCTAGGSGGGIGGGLIVIVCKGKLTIGSTGIVSARGLTGGNGGNGGNAAGSDSSGGGGGGGQGGGGGGVIVLAYRGTYSNAGTVRVNGGSYGTGGTYGTGNGTGKVGVVGSNGTSGTVGTIVTAQL